MPRLLPPAWVPDGSIMLSNRCVRCLTETEEEPSTDNRAHVIYDGNSLCLTHFKELAASAGELEPFLTDDQAAELATLVDDRTDDPQTYELRKAALPIKQPKQEQNA